MSRIGVIAPWAATVVIFLAAVSVLATFMVDPRTQLDLATASLLLLIGVWSVVHASVGTVIAWRRPGNRIGRLMQLAAPLLILAFFGYLVGAVRYILVGSTDLLGGLAAWWASTTLVPVLVLAFPLLGIVYPDGRLPTPSFRRPLVLIFAGLVGTSAVSAIAAGPVASELPDNPFGLIDLSPVARSVLGLIVLVGLVCAIVMAVMATVIRWRRGTKMERAQLKWLLATLVVAAPLFVFSWGSDVGPAALVDLLSIGSALAIPIAIGVAIFRYRLYEIDRLISRTIGWALVTGLIVAVFVIGLIGLQALLAGFTQGQTFAVAVSTLAAFALFQPLRRWVQRAVDRRFDRARYDGERTAAAFAARMRDQVDLAGLEADIAATAGAALRPSAVSVWTRSTGGDR